MKKEALFRPAFILCLIGFIATGMLAMTHYFTKDIIEGLSGEKQMTNRQQIFPDAMFFSEVDLNTINISTGNVTNIFIAADDQKQLLGILIVAHAHGYSGEVPVMAGITTDGSIAGIRVLPNSETPNLGTLIEEPEFTDQFKDLDITRGFTMRFSDTGEHLIDAVTAATASSRAVVNAVNTIAELYAEIEVETIFSGIDFDTADMEVE